MLDHRSSARLFMTAANVALTLATVLLALLFVAVVLVASLEGLPAEGSQASNVVSAVGEALLGRHPQEVFPRVLGACWFFGH